MASPLNVNGIGTSEKKSSLSMIDKDTILAELRERTRKPVVRTEQYIDAKADRLVAKFDAPESRAFYCDCARYLSEDFIECAIENAFRPRPRNPIRNKAAYFGKICVNELVKLGIYRR